MRTDDIVIAGAGIGGLVTAMSLAQAGFPVQVFETVDEVKALGVGINLLPHAVRELDAIGLLDELRSIAVAPSTLTYFTKHGKVIWSEPRGIDAGYAWPQLSIHRGNFQTRLFELAAERIGRDRIHLGLHLERFENIRDRRSGAATTVTAPALIASDGIHSSARKQLHPDEGMPIWNGAKLWRGAVETDAVLDGRTLVWCGHPQQKFIAYPVRDLGDGRQLLNFIAELRTDETTLAQREDWNQPGVLSDFLPWFESWTFDWLDVPALLRAAPGTFLFPMVDRDPLDRWTYDRMTLLGDAAHPMYPVGSNGASQAILDARVLTGCLKARPNDVPAALREYDSIRRPATANIVLANRGFGPELPMKLVEERAPDGFDAIGDVISPDEILEVTDGYRRTAGFALSELSDPAAPSLADRTYGKDVA
jgi:2-polyprenyl-6-methoxyphenol hydroxylase-like FAD-dependent oxidoreductase